MTNNPLLCRNVFDDSKWASERKGQEGREGRGARDHVGKRVLRQLDLFLVTVCLIRCPFMELPVVGRRERDTHLHKAEVFAVLLTGLEERQRDVRNVIMSRLLEKCRCLSESVSL